MSTPLKVLIVEDSEDDAELILRELRNAGFDPESERVGNLEDLRRALGRKPWQVIICDHNMPGFDSFRALETVRDHDIDLPFIVVSGAIIDDVAVKTMKAGAHDYLKKDNLARLAPAIERELLENEVRQQRKKAERSLAEKSSLLSTTFESMDQGFVVFDADRRLVAFNHRYAELLEYPAGYVQTGRSFEEIVRFNAERGLYGAGEAEDYVAEHLQSLGKKGLFESEINRADGAVISIRRRPMPDGGFVSTFTDITERKRAEDKASNSAALLQTSLENMGHGICVFDAGHKVVAYNKPYLLMARLPEDLDPMGLSYEQILRHRVVQGVFDEEELQRRLKLIEDDIKPEIREHVHPDGFVFVYQRRPMPDGGFVLTYTDITARKRAEDQLRELNETLEEKVLERTAELKSAQEGLLRAERLATLGQLTGTVAHELRNPLGAVSATAKTIEHTIQGAGLNLEKMFARMDRGIQRCDNIITELLDFARVKGLEAEPTPLDDWVSQALDEIAIPQGITLHRTLEATGVVAEFDRDRMHRALINVVDNACQAMGGDDGEVTVSTHAGGDRAEITITDTGPGIPEDVLPKIFEPLFSTKQFGVGLGLPTVRQIMDEHDGGFEIANGEGGGTRATLWLPLAVSVADTKAEDIRTSA